MIGGFYCGYSKAAFAINVRMRIPSCGDVAATLDPPPLKVHECRLLRSGLLRMSGVGELDAPRRALLVASRVRLGLPPRSFAMRQLFVDRVKNPIHTMSRINMKRNHFLFLIKGYNRIFRPCITCRSGYTLVQTKHFHLLQPQCHEALNFQ